MTNFEHMTEEEKKLAIMYGLHITHDGEVKVCCEISCKGCRDNSKCSHITIRKERETWLNAEYVKPKTKNEKFCETLKDGEVIAVSNFSEKVIHDCLYHKFKRYDESDDVIITKNDYQWRYGRKLTAEEKGE